MNPVKTLRLHDLDDYTNPSCYFTERLRLCLEKVLYLGKPQDRTFRKSWLMLQSPPTRTEFLSPRSDSRSSGSPTV